MATKTQRRELWDFVKPPAVEEDASDTGTALYTPAYHLFAVRFVLGIVSMVLAFSDWESWSYRFPHMFSCSFLYIIESVAFFVLAAASLCVALDFRVKIRGTVVEALYFTAGTLSIAGTIVNSMYFPALLMMFSHYAMAPKIRVRPWFIVLPVLCHVPHTISEVFVARYPQHNGVLGYFVEMVGLAAAGVAALLLCEMMKYAELKLGKPLGTETKTDSYSAI